MTIAELYTIFLQHPSVQTDTRQLKKGDLFFALKGPSFNGNQFALQALAAGAAYAVIDEPVADDDERLILVEDVLTTLQELAKHHRDQFFIPLIAITGSNGKTTTKELVHAVLNAQYITYTTEGNLNNHIGIPLTLLRIQKDVQFAVIEMGANHQHEIAGYCEYVQPTHGIITNVGKAHLEGFGGEEGVRKGKGELFEYLRMNNGSIFAFDDYDYLHEMTANIPKVSWYGTQKGLVRGRVLQSEPFLEIEMTFGILEFDTLQTQLVGSYNLPNVLCAIAVGKYFDVPEFKIKAAISHYVPSNSRSQLVAAGTNKIILDAYNANPSSMKAAIENFAKVDAPAKVLLLGGMMELGAESVAEHQHLVSLIGQYPWQQVVLVGGDFANVQHPYQYFASAAEAGEWVKAQQFTNTYFLIKGSRSMQMEKTTQYI